MSFDLLKTVENGGCSAKLSPRELADALRALPRTHHPDLLVDIETHDDAGVFRVTDEIALVQTVDFFPPVCSDPYEFGQIAAANALSDVYAMGGKPITAMNIVTFPSLRIPLEVLVEILRGGHDKVVEAGAVLVGGHTIDDYPPKYGLAVTGIVHPMNIVTNAAAQPGDLLILTKPIGTGILTAAHRLGEARPEAYRAALNTMKELNRTAGELLREYHVRCATDITGFGLLGHAYKMALASKVTIVITSATVPLLPQVYELADQGCIPGAAFRNMTFVESGITFDPTVEYTRKMVLADAQTSGGLLICVPPEKAESMIGELRKRGCTQAAVVGMVSEAGSYALEVR